MIEYKSIELELSDLNKERRTAVIAHAVYDNIDRAKDISRKGMFSRSWKASKPGDIIFDIDHDRSKQPGKTIAVYEDEKKAYTKVSFGTHTLGNDTMLMMDEGIIRGASFEYITQKKATKEYKGQTVRELLEVQHLATTVTLALPPINPEAGVISVTKADRKALEQYKAHIDRLELFCRNTTATDDLIIRIEAEIKAAREIFNRNDTVDTLLITDQSASVKAKFSNALHLLTLEI